MAPVITAAPRDRTDLQGDSAVFTCEATARPRPDITWWRDGAQVSEETDNIDIDSQEIGEERERRSSLTISEVQPSDAGMYTCRAENAAGSAEATATLTVHG